MTNHTQLRMAAREIFEATLRAVDAGAALRRAVRLEGSRLSICDTALDIDDRPVYSIAIGKAAVKMASALEQILDGRLAGGVVTGDPRGIALDERANLLTEAGEPQTSTPALPQRHTVFYGGHPEPNEYSLAAARACFDLLDKVNREPALVIFLTSGGGSAMIEWPISDEITLADLRTANKALVNSGASIAEINSVRRAFSAVKGGRLAARAPNCEQVTLIVSDVPAGEERNVASGPSLAPPKDAPDAREVLARYNLHSHLPVTIVRAVEFEPRLVLQDSSVSRPHFVLLNNRSALEAAAEAARERNFVTGIAGDISDQPIEKGCAQILERLTEFQDHVDEAPNESIAKVICMISGGEFACPVRGDGIGGRNLETALRLACAANPSLSDNKHFVALCAGT